MKDSGRKVIETAEELLCYLRVNLEEVNGSLESLKNGFQSLTKLEEFSDYHIICF